MARKPNYQMERKDRDRAKAIKTAAKDLAKQAGRDQPTTEEAATDAPSPDPQ
jgi:hypothetical protein